MAPPRPGVPIPVPHTLPCTEGQQGGSGGSCPSRGEPVSGSSDSNGAHPGGFAALPSLGKGSSLVPSGPSVSPQAGQGQGQDKGPRSRVALQIHRVGTARQPPRWLLFCGQTHCHGAAWLVGGLWHPGVPTRAPWCQPGGCSGPLLPAECSGVQGPVAGLSPCALGAKANLDGDSAMRLAWGWPGLGGSQGRFACIPALGAGVLVPQFGEHYSPPQDTSGSQ